MAGHSHWAGIKHKKAVIDNKRGKLWSKLSKAIMVAAKMGGADLDTNVRLRTAINDAKAVSMPKDNIERAVKKGTGELEADNYEEVIYEGYGPNGVAIMCESLTDNRNRTAPELRQIFEKHGGKLGATNCVAYLFDRKGLFLVDKSNASEEQLMEIALEAGADDVTDEGEQYQIICTPDNFMGVLGALEKAQIELAMKEVTRIPSDTIDLDESTARTVLKLMEALDDHDDIQNVSANFNISEEVMATLE